MRQILDLIRRNQVHELGRRLLTLTEAERGEIGRALPGLVKDLRAEKTAELARRDYAADWERAWDEGFEIDEMLDGLATALLLAGLGTITGPAAAVSFVTGRDVNRRRALGLNVADAVRVAASRPVEWQQDVAVRLARRIRRPDDRIAPLAVALLRASGAEPPDHDPLVVAWLRMMTHPNDPLTSALLLRVFDAEGAGRELRDERLTPAPTRWLARVRRDVPRDQAIDGCVSRFLRGGEAQDLRFFVRLHDLLAPTPEETAGRLRDYLRLLPSSPGPVAELAARQVKAVFPIDRADLVEAVESLTFRAEAKLATIGLRWLDAELKRTPSAAAEFGPALVTAYGHTSFDVQSRAVDLTLKHVTDGSLVADGIAALPADLAALLTTRFSGEPSFEEPAPAVTFPPLPAVPAPKPFPEPSSSAVREPVSTWIGTERWLAAFTRDATRDRAALRSSLRRRDHWWHRSWVWADPRDWMEALSAELITPGWAPEEPPAESWPWDHQVMQLRVYAAPDEDEMVLEERVGRGRGLTYGFTGYLPEAVLGLADDPSVKTRGTERLPELRRVTPLHLFLLHRFSELYDALRDDVLPPVLLATPTLDNGHLDPEVLVDRLETCAEAGREPLPADLAQALMRLPRGAHPAAAERAAKVGSAAARAAAGWLAGDGLPDPVTGVEWTGEGDHVRVRPLLRLAAPTGDRLIDEVMLAQPGRHVSDEFARHPDWYAPMVPSHREVASANCLAQVTGPWHYQRLTVAAFRRCAAADGPLGDASAVVLGLLLVDRDRDDPMVGLLLDLAAQGALPVEALGRQLGELVRRARSGIRPLVAALSELAQEGAPHQVWAVLRGLLPHLLPRAGERATTPQSEAVAFATEVASWIGATGEIPEITALAARTGRSRFTRECRRLRDRLAPAQS
ncbi:hypothetical protein GT755_19160 [Herbidospora sp. NEAU-GS84]|uniref:Secreted protein n=1 Tax=Herbidospora solisilvae TaxID=2696284 RepID=A0A7C9J402_9ACTN|nr:DUF6493 family protein [Herbidospora solisilvae]NAS23805.1 hypothetical protein [Herbidospora solisilvae]